jgi:hypothetical protein
MEIEESTAKQEKKTSPAQLLKTLEIQQSIKQREEEK